MSSTRILRLSEEEEAVLVEMFSFCCQSDFTEHQDDPKIFDDLWEKVSDPEPFDYV